MSSHRDHNNALIPSDAIVAAQAMIGNNCSEEHAADVIVAVMPHLYKALNVALADARAGAKNLLAHQSPDAPRRNRRT